ncbi:centrosomal protein of 120 kDa-like [Cylas formicarius]|uniref:centrosomal protein of 120 kDa-like n=1 Tax=Cylas formicarius TaxID=197179 RepID=UPI0029589537|nr:centrosomal protein of 120 kDa-like [Cylas formicarius]
MNQLNGKYVNVVLSVEDGRELDFVKHRVHLSANFSGRILESDSVLPEESTPFNTELIWEIEKKDLRKIRTINQLLRLECISTDSYNRRERIGFVLFSLRSAQIVPSKEPNIPVRFKWHKLVGCQADKKKFHPELYVALTVRDHLPNQEENIKPHNAPLISEQDVVEQLELPSECYVKYLDDGYIQIGTGDYPESYSLNLLIEEAKNLDALLPEEMVFKENPEKLHMSFTIFGVTIKTKPFYKQVDGVTNLNEKVVVRLLSNEQTLFDFFVNQCVTISIFSGRDMLGVAKEKPRSRGTNLRLPYKSICG